MHVQQLPTPIVLIAPSGEDSLLVYTYDNLTGLDPKDPQLVPIGLAVGSQSNLIFASAGTTRAEWTKRLAKGETAVLPLPDVNIGATIDLKLIKADRLLQRSRHQH